MTIWQPALDGRSGPRYRAVADALEQDVAAGTLAPGARLPTHRDLAWRLGVTVGTVTRAYREAERRGLVAGEVGRGTFVLPRAAAGGTLVIPTGGDDDRLDLRVNLPAINLGSDALSGTFAELAALALERLAGFLTYQPERGAARHRTAGAAWCARAGLDVPAREVVVTAGAQHGLLVALVRPGDAVLVEELTYSGLKVLADMLRLRLIPVAMDADGLRPDALDAALAAEPARVLYCQVTLHNPTTATMPTARRRDIAAVLARHDAIVIEDDVYGLLPEERPPPLVAFARDRGVFVTSVSKGVAPGLRVGYLRAPEALVGAMGAMVRSTMWMVAALPVEVATRWIEDGTADRAVAWHRREAAARQKLLTRHLGHAQPVTQACSYHAWLPLPEPWRAQDFVTAAAAQGVDVTNPDIFVAGRATAPHAVRICLGGTTTRDDLTRGLATLAKVLRGRRQPLAAVV